MPYLQTLGSKVLVGLRLMPLFQALTSNGSGLKMGTLTPKAPEFLCDFLEDFMITCSDPDMICTVVEIGPQIYGMCGAPAVLSCVCWLVVNVIRGLKHGPVGLTTIRVGTLVI